MSAYFSLRAVNHVAQNTPHAARLFRGFIGFVLSAAIVMTVFDLGPNGRQDWGVNAATIDAANAAAKADCMDRESAAYCAFVRAGD